MDDLRAPATAAPAPFDPSHVYPQQASLDALRYDVQTVYGVLLHAEHAAADRHDVGGESAYHHAAAVLARLMWTDTAA